MVFLLFFYIHSTHTFKEDADDAIYDLHNMISPRNKISVREGVKKSAIWGHFPFSDPTPRGQKKKEAFFFMNNSRYSTETTGVTQKYEKRSKKAFTQKKFKHAEYL